MTRTIIVGAGINGLLLGALLAHDGDEVTVFEKNSFPGGRALLLERDGYVMDYGVHLTRFGPESALAKIMRQIGHAVSFTKLGTSYLIDQNGKKVLFPTSPAASSRAISSPSRKNPARQPSLKVKKDKLNMPLICPFATG